MITTVNDVISVVIDDTAGAPGTEIKKRITTLENIHYGTCIIKDTDIEVCAFPV